MDAKTGSEVIESWPEESREAAQLVIDTYGEPHEITQSFLVWHKTGPWKRIVASRSSTSTRFPRRTTTRWKRCSITESRLSLHTARRIRWQRHRRAHGRRSVRSLP